MKPNICSVIVIEWCMYAVTDVEYHKTARRVRALLFYITRPVSLSQGKFLARVTCQDNHLSHCRYTHTHTCRGPRLIICHEILYINFAAPRTHGLGSGCGAVQRRGGGGGRLKKSQTPTTYYNVAKLTTHGSGYWSGHSLSLLHQS